MTKCAKYRIGFFTANSFVISLKKSFTSNLRSLTRDGVEIMTGMSGTLYHYYVAGIPVPIAKKYMTMSVTVNMLTQQFRQVFPSREETKEIWMFYESKIPGRIIPVRYFVLTEHEIKIR